jgi:tetratricopeptide (TPR) repeat protein
MTRPQPFGTATAAAISDPVEAASALRAQGRLEEALDVLSRQGNFPADFYTLRGDIQLELGRIGEAAGSYFTVVASEPKNVYAQNNLAQCLRRLERWEAAAEAFQRVLEIDAHRDSARIALGDCLLHLNRLEQALECFDLCWSDAARVQALFGKAVVLQLLRRFDEAENTYQRLLELDPKAEEALANLIAMSMEVFDLERVHRYSTRLLEASPHSTIALQGLTVVALERREHEHAARYFARLLERAPASIANTGEDEDDATIEYRLSHETVDYLKRTEPASRALGRY